MGNCFSDFLYSIFKNGVEVRNGKIYNNADNREKVKVAVV